MEQQIPELMKHIREQSRVLRSKHAILRGEQDTTVCWHEWNGILTAPTPILADDAFHAAVSGFPQRFDALSSLISYRAVFGKLRPRFEAKLYFPAPTDENGLTDSDVSTDIDHLMREVYQTCPVSQFSRVSWHVYCRICELYEFVLLFGRRIIEPTTVNKVCRPDFNALQARFRKQMKDDDMNDDDDLEDEDDDDDEDGRRNKGKHKSARPNKSAGSAAASRRLEEASAEISRLFSYMERQSVEELMMLFVNKDKSLTIDRGKLARVIGLRSGSKPEKFCKNVRAELGAAFQ